MLDDCPIELEAARCPLCEEEEALLVGTRGRFDMPVRNVACARCGCVRVDPRPTPAAMDAYYRGAYRDQYRYVKLPDAHGRPVGPDDAGYLEARAHRYREQARLALALGGLGEGQRALEVGCRDGQTLAHMCALGRVEVVGIEPGPAEAAEAQSRGLEIFCGPLEEFETDLGFDQVQMFHVLEHLHDPLGALARLAGWLKPGGRLLIEVPNVAHPYGRLESNFFQNAHLYSFSPNTLVALIARAGLEPVHVVDSQSLMVLAERPVGGDPLSTLEFHPSLLPDPSQNGEWIEARLRAYDRLQQAVEDLASGRFGLDTVEALRFTLSGPSFAAPTLGALRRMWGMLARVGAWRVVLTLAEAASRGPHPSELILECHRVRAEASRRLAGAPAAGAL